jgi:bacterioferritin-associated ferredoxin
MAVIVCSCNVLSEAQVRDAVAADTGPRKTIEVYRCLGCSPQCGRCARTVRAILDEALARPCDTCPAVCSAAGHSHSE